MKEFLLDHADRDPVSFHMPGHKGSAFFRKYGYGEFLDRFVDCDVTEIPGADNLFQAEGIIKGVMERYARLYDVRNSFLLINGSSGGLIASVMASVRPGGKLIMARNCHKSVFNALTLAGVSPVYAQPEFIDEYGISGAVPVEEIVRCMDENPDAEAVILPSPNYYGICSDIESIAKSVHARDKVLIVDQAHGAHLHFFHKFGFGEGMPKSAEESGADLVIGSIHKTLASLTQSAILNHNTDRVSKYVLEDKLQMIESTSPSYVLMSFLDINAEILEKHGAQAMGEWRRALDEFYVKLRQISDLRIMGDGGSATAAGSMDLTKVNIDMGAYCIDGAALEQELMKYDIFSELYAGNVLMLMTGIGNTAEHFDRTIVALKDIAARHEADHHIRRTGVSLGSGADSTNGKSRFRAPAAGKLNPIPVDKELVPLDDAAGRICASSIIPYPPGIPFVCPGEEITEEMIAYVKALRDGGEKVIGLTDRSEVIVGK
ncbi:MAG: aminotransferase class I/II-fold pyridoxal phosphate-dependent enzyme [Bacillota bacterium]